MSTNRVRPQRQPGKRMPRQPGRRPPRPLPPGDSLLTPGASPGRRTIEQRSAAPLLMLHQMPRWLLPIVLVALLVIGLAVPGLAGAIALVGVAGVLAWLAALSWPRLSGQGRLLRVATVAAVLAVAIIRGLH